MMKFSTGPEVRAYKSTERKAKLASSPAAKSHGHQQQATEPLGPEKNIRRGVVGGQNIIKL